MSPQTIKMVTMFFLATALLNVTNYLFYWFYNPPSHQAMKLETSKRTNVFSFTSRPHVVHTVQWTALLLGRDDESLGISNEDTSTGSADVNYRDPTADSELFYFNGGKKAPLCPQKPPGLGPVNTDSVSLEAIEELYASLEVGGLYQKTNCTPRQSVAIIVPYRGQKSQLLHFLYILHSILIKQQLEYQIFVLLYNTSRPLNLGKLMNAGFAEAQRSRDNGPWRCVVFHEADLMPADSRNLYRCSSSPHQLVTFVGNRSYEHQFGGAIAIGSAQFLKVNGFSNLYSENEAVYEDLYKRLLDANYTATKSVTFGKYSRLTGGDNTNQTKFRTIQTSAPLNLIDGLSTLTYKLKSIELKQMYTVVNVDVYTPQSNATEKTWNRLLSQAALSVTRRHTQDNKNVIRKGV